MGLLTNIHWIALGALIGILAAVCYLSYTGSALKWKK